MVWEDFTDIPAFIEITIGESGPESIWMPSPKQHHVSHVERNGYEASLSRDPTALDKTPANDMETFGLAPSPASQIMAQPTAAERVDPVLGSEHDFQVAHSDEANGTRADIEKSNKIFSNIDGGLSANSGNRPSPIFNALATIGRSLASEILRSEVGIKGDAVQPHYSTFQKRDYSDQPRCSRINGDLSTDGAVLVNSVSKRARTVDTRDFMIRSGQTRALSAAAAPWVVGENSLSAVQSAACVSKEYQQAACLTTSGQSEADLDNCWQIFTVSFPHHPSSSLGLYLSTGVRSSADGEADSVLVVDGVVPGSYAAESGLLRRGDELREVNGNSVRGLVSNAIVGLVSACKGPVISLLLRRRRPASTVALHHGSRDRGAAAAPDAGAASSSSPAHASFASSCAVPNESVIRAAARGNVESPRLSTVQASAGSGRGRGSVSASSVIEVILMRRGGSFGFSMQSNPTSAATGSVRVHQILVGSSASMQGLCVGDELLSVDDHSCVGCDAPGVRALILAAGPTVHLRVRRFRFSSSPPTQDGAADSPAIVAPPSQRLRSSPKNKFRIVSARVQTCVSSSPRAVVSAVAATPLIHPSGARSRVLIGRGYQAFVPDWSFAVVRRRQEEAAASSRVMVGPTLNSSDPAASESGEGGGELIWSPHSFMGSLVSTSSGLAPLKRLFLDVELSRFVLPSGSMGLGLHLAGRRGEVGDTCTYIVDVVSGRSSTRTGALALAGDEVWGIEGQSVRGYSVKEVYQRILASPGPSVRLLLSRQLVHQTQLPCSISGESLEVQFPLQDLLRVVIGDSELAGVIIVVDAGSEGSGICEASRHILRCGDELRRIGGVSVRGMAVDAVRAVIAGANLFSSGPDVCIDIFRRSSGERESCLGRRLTWARHVGLDETSTLGLIHSSIYREDLFLNALSTVHLPKTTQEWSVEEREVFASEMRKEWKDFKAIKAALGGRRTLREVIEYYYSFYKTSKEAKSARPPTMPSMMEELEPTAVNGEGSAPRLVHTPGPSGFPLRSTHFRSSPSRRESG